MKKWTKANVNNVSISFSQILKFMGKKFQDDIKDPKVISKNSSADEIANVNFLRRHRTRTTKYEKEEKNEQLSSR